MSTQIARSPEGEAPAEPARVRAGRQMQEPRARGNMRATWEDAKMVRCKLCGKANARPFDTQPLAAWWRCAGCGLFFVDPQPDAQTLAGLYRDRYYLRHADNSREALAKAERIWGGRADALMRLSRPGRVLDVGCGRGHFVAAARQRGWDAWGMEADPNAAAGALPQVREWMVIGCLEDAPFPRHAFSMLTLFDVIEHVRDPVAFLNAAHHLLERGGILAVTTPNAGMIKVRLRGRRWRYFDFERYLHLFNFTATTLERAFAAAGFETARWLKHRGMPLFVAGRAT